MDSRWLLLWCSLGALLRFTHLSTKPPWVDEFATLVFSLGNRFGTVPLNQVLPASHLLTPLYVGANPLPTQLNQTITHLFAESTHPPLYFMLAGVWMRIWQAPGELASIGVGRSLPVLLGIILIPLSFALAQVVFANRIAAHLSALWMATSPYSVYLTQEARHYSLAMIWVSLSLLCTVRFVQQVEQGQAPPRWLAVLWVVINGLGIATHYFFLLSLGAIAISLLILWFRQPNPSLPYPRWSLSVIVGTLVTALAWAPLLMGLYSSDATQWIQSPAENGFLAGISPLLQAIAAWITMLLLLPVEANSLSVVIASGVAMLGVLVIGLPALIRGYRFLYYPIGAKVLSGVIVAAIAILFTITYGMGADLTRGARYHFVYFPAIIALLGGSSAVLWRQQRWGDRAKLGLLLLAALLSALTVVSNLGYRKYYDPAKFLTMLRDHAQAPVLVATTHRTFIPVGELMGLAHELHRQGLADEYAPQFLLAVADQNPCETECRAIATLENTVQTSPRPFELWLVNPGVNSRDLRLPGCTRQDPNPRPYATGYTYRRFLCPPR